MVNISLERNVTDLNSTSNSNSDKVESESVIKISALALNLFYDNIHALKNINIKIEINKVTSLIGPSGCGKSSFIKSLNRLNDLVPNAVIKGEVLIDGENICI